MTDNSLLRAEEGLAETYGRHMETVYRLCYIYLQNVADAEDAVQTVFLKLLKAQKKFNDYEHEKAWLITAAKNHCKDVLKSWWRTRRTDLDKLPEAVSWGDNALSSDVLSKLLALPGKYKTVLYLHYFEGYGTKELSEMLHCKESTIRTQLARGRVRLKLDLGGNYHA
jgi:RNA polymerase sigma-70 factor (ECF subfamily)